MKANSIELTDNIMRLLSSHARKLQQSTQCQHVDEIECYELQQRKIRQNIELGQPIMFVLPAFPAKSPNRDKTMGILPDMGERMALRSLQDLCEQIKIHYLPGAQIIICSDGRVFNDLVCVVDEDVDAYAQGIRTILQHDGLTNLTTYALDDHYPSHSYNEMRAQLLREFGEPIAQLKQRIKAESAARSLFNGIHRFIFEDQQFMHREISRNKLREMAKEIAYQVIQRSNAWSRFIENKFPDAVRLSIHPQGCGSEKFGIMLLNSSDVWATPWHRVLLLDGDEPVLIRKNEAEAMGANPIFVNNQFSHYVR